LDVVVGLGVGVFSGLVVSGVGACVGAFGFVMVFVGARCVEDDSANHNPIKNKTESSTAVIGESTLNISTIIKYQIEMAIKKIPNLCSSGRSMLTTIIKI